MDNRLEKLIRRMLSSTRKSKAWVRVLSALSCVVVFITAYALILPAITMSQDVYCGMGGHSHGEECTKQVLACTLTEEPDHVHTPECWGSRPVLLCTDESAEHEHTEECWSTVEEQICNPHVHDEHCYKQELICTLPEHVHSDACYEMPEETVPQDESFWQQLVPTLTKNWASDFMSAVRSQVGYTVSVIDKDENGNASSVYGAHYGTPYSNWDAAFLSWCLDRAAVPQYAGENVTVTVPQSSDTLNWLYALNAAGYYNDYVSDWTPNEADIMFFRFTDDDAVRAAAVEGAEWVEYGELTVIYAIMGDYENSVAPVELYTKEIEIFGWAVLPENPELKITETEIENDSEVEDELVPIDLGSSEGLGENFTENNFNGIAFSPAKTLGDEGFAMVSLLSLEDEGIMPLDVEPPLNVREYILNNSTGVVVKWHEYHDAEETGTMPWKDLPTDGTEIPANAHLRVEVKYANVKPEDLAASGYQMVYVPDSLMTGLLADGDILVNNVPHGTITVEEVEVDGKMQRAIVLRFDPEWVNGLVSSNSDPNNTSNKRTISGDFYFQGELDLENLDDAENKELNLGPIRIQLPVKENAAARYAEATVEKGDPSLVSEVINGKTCYFLEYTLDVTTGKYGIPDIKVTDTITNKTATINGAQVEFIGSHPYVGLREAQLSSAVTVSKTPGAQNFKPVETVTLGTNGQLAQSTRNGQLYYTSKPNYSDTGYAEPDPAGESLVWDIGDMGPYEHRTLTYRVAVNDNFVGINHPDGSTVTNTAALTSSGYPHGTDSTLTTPNGTASIRKQYSRVEGPSEDGKYIIHYTVTVTTPATNDYTMTNLKIYDVLSDNRVDSATLMDSEGNPVLDPVTKQPITYWDLVSYNFTNENTADLTIDGMSIADFNNAHSGETPASVTVQNGATSSRNPYFDLYIGDMAPNTTRTITYSMTLDSRTAAMGNNVGIDNRAEIHDDDTKDGGNKRLNESNVSVSPSGQRWDRKLGGSKLTLGKRIEMGDAPVYEKSGSSYVQSTNHPENFTVPAGSFSYTVIVNEKGEWDVSATSLNDSLATPNGMTQSPLKFTGYLQLDVYDRLTTMNNPSDDTILGLANTSTPEKTIWVKIDGDRSFDLNANALGIDPTQDGKTYVLRYYAAVDDSMKVSNVIVGNDFTMSGTIGNGNGTIYLNGIRSTKTVTATGVYQCNIRKEFWYYDEFDRTFSYVNAAGETIYPGSLYWAIKIDATKIASGSMFQESCNPYTSFNTILRKESSLLGFYIGNIDEVPGPNKSQEYMRDRFESYDELISSGKLRKVTFNYTSAWSSGNTNNNNGWAVDKVGVYGEDITGYRGYNFDFTITVNEDVGIAPEESVYLLIKTEPFKLPLPSGQINSKNFSNKVNHYDPLNPPKGGSWPYYSAQTTLWAGTTGLEKSAGSVFKVSGADDLTWEEYRGNYVNNQFTSKAVFQKYVEGAGTNPGGFQNINGVHWGYGSDNSRANEEIPLSMLVKGSSKAELATYYDISNGRTYQHTNDQALNYKYKDGVYVTWLITANKTQQLKQGEYTIIDDLPAGVELAYVRTYSGVSENYNIGTFGLQNAKYRVTGDNAKYADWVPHSIAAPRNGDTWLTTYTNYYTKANQIAIYIPTLYTNTQPVFQVVCRVTDPNSYFEDVQLTNVAKLYDARGLEIDARSSTIWARNGSLSKEDLVSSGNTLNTNILPYELVLNETAGDMQPGADVVGVPLIDHMSSNLSVNMETLKIYAGSVSPENLIYSGENERTAITAGTQRLYYAVDEDGNQLYWQGTPAAHTTDEATDFRVITTKVNVYGTTTQINENDSFYYVASTGQEVIGAGTFEETETAFNDETGIPSGNYIIKSAQGTPYVTDQMTAQPRLIGAENREDATVFTITNNGPTYTVTSNGKYMSIPADQKALMQNDVQNLFIQKFTASFNNKAVRFCNAGSGPTYQYLNRQNGNVQFGGYSNANGPNSAFYLYKEQSHLIAANTALYWDENAAIGTTPTDYPVITTNPAASLIGAHFELLSKDAGTNQVQGNVPNAFHKVNEYGQPLYRTADGTETTDAAGNTPIMVTTTIRVAVEPYVNEAGVADGTKIIKFYELPDSTKLIIKYDVSASLVTGGNGNSYSNSAYWDEHTASGDGITGSDNMVLDVEGTATAEVHGAVKITKYNGSNTAQKLSGAEFTLYRAAYIMGAPGSEWTLIETKNPETNIITTSYQQNTGAAQYPAIYSVTEVNGQKVDTPMHPVRDVEGNLRGFMIDNQFVNIQDNSLATMTFEHKLDKTDDGKLKLDPTILGQKTTGADGIVSYGFDAKESNIHFNKVYAIKETVAPEGYDLDQTIYYFVVPNQNLGGIGMNYFYHNNESDFPEEVHIVRRSEGDVLTYFLDVYDYKGTVQVMKEFGGNSSPDGNYKEGTYRFGIWPAKYVDANGVPWGNDYRLDTGAISYSSTDFGMFKTVNGSQNWTEYRQNGNRWQSRSFTYDADGNETASEWAFISNPPTDLEYGILPNCRKVITFSNLTFNEDYYIFELDSNDFPILSSGTVGNDKFYVSYGTPVGQDPIYIPGTDKLAVDGNRVTPYKGQPGSIVVPVVIATNRSYELSITKNFTDNDEQLAEGIIGTYKFGIWKLPMTEPMTERNAFSTGNIYFHKGDRVPSKTVYFRNLDPGSYAVCEIDENGNAVQNNELITVEGKTFNVIYKHGNEVIINPDSTVEQNVEVTNDVAYFALPHTGGMGTEMFTYGGLSLMVIACLGYSACVLLRRRRKGDST